MKKGKISISYYASVIVLMVAILFVLFFAHYRNSKTNFNYISKYIEQLSETTAKYASNVFTDNLSAIESVAYLYGTSIKEASVNLELLKVLEEKTEFDKIRFMSADGTDYGSDGRVTYVKDRAYYVKGMQGKSGICEVLESRVTGEKLIGFYAPVYYEKEICGIMVGFLSEKDISSILAANLMGYPVNSYLVACDGKVLGQNMEEGTVAVDKIDELIVHIENDYRKDVANAIKDHSKYFFTFNGSMERSVGYVIPIQGTEWSLVELFPSEATYTIAKNALFDSILVFGIISVIFLIFTIFLVSRSKKEAKKKAEELINNKISSIMRGINNDYLMMADVNIESGAEVLYRLSSEVDLVGWPVEGQYYSNNVIQFANSVIAEYDRERFIEATRFQDVVRILREKKVYYVEYDAYFDGEIRNFQSKYIIPDDEEFENHMLISIRDITEAARKSYERERELTEARNMAESANRAKTTFLFNMSHDIRTPMNAIVGFNKLIEKYIDDKERVREYIKKIETSSDFLLSLINNVLEMARIESGKMKLDESLQNIEHFNDMLVSVFEEQFRQKNLHFKKTINIVHKEILCDELKIKEIYLNILSNAIKYTPEGGSITMTLEELPSDKEGYGIYKGVVTDTGIGMSEEYLSHIFEEFTRESTVTESKIAGTGLGMPIVKKIVEFIGGTIGIESKPGVGTTVTVMIPHRIADKETVEEMQEHFLEYTEESFKGYRILLAEDNDTNAEISREILSSVGFVLERAVDGIECVHKLTEKPENYYDIILMDIQMPNMNGYEAARTIRSLEGSRCSIPIVAMTANAFDEDRNNALEAGMNEHISKPVDIPRLFETLMKILKEK